MQSTGKIENHQSQAGLLEALAKELEGTDRFFLHWRADIRRWQVCPHVFYRAGHGACRRDDRRAHAKVRLGAV